MDSKELGSKPSGESRPGSSFSTRLLSSKSPDLNLPLDQHPAWTEILGNLPAPGYQRTYFSAATRSQVSLNGVTTSAEYEKQMTWQMQGGLRRVTSYGSPARAFRYELNEMVKSFLQSNAGTTNFLRPNSFNRQRPAFVGRHQLNALRSRRKTPGTARHLPGS